MDKLFDFVRKAIDVDADTELTRDQKDKKLATIMTEMERAYRIPILRNSAWEEENPEVIRVYKEISDMRKL